MRPFKPFQIYLASLILLAAIFSAYIYYGQYTSSTICIGGASCSVVQSSSYGEFLGIKVSVLGACVLFLLFAIYLFSRSSYKNYRLYYLAVILGSLGSLYFIAIQAFVLKQWCSSCMVVDSLMILILVLSTLEFLKLRKYY